MQFRILWDHPERCPYRDNQVARLPLRVPLRPLRPADFDQMLAEGDRRTGRMLYRTACPSCTACHPLRVPVQRFEATRSQKRVWKKNEDLELRISKPALTRDRLRMYNRHKLERGLSSSGEPLTAESYRAWLMDTCVDTREFQYLFEDKLIGVTIVDLGGRAASSVYHYFDPDYDSRSLGVYSALRELEWCKQQGLDWYYFGFYVQDCSHLRYKANYYPHQRRADGVWTEYSSAEDVGKVVEVCPPTPMLVPP
jgi:arginine-tRNA-protein transferase